MTKTLEPFQSLSLDVPVVEQPSASLPTSLESLNVLFYRHGNDPHTKSIYFVFHGTFKQAIERGRKFCEKLGWRFIKVEPFLTDLDEKERKLGE